MVRALINWSLHNPFVVILVAVVWAVVGTYAFMHVNVEAYPDPAPAIVEVVAQYPGASAEEVERQVSVPLEVAFAGMPGLTMTRSKSLFGLCHIRNQFEYGRNFWDCRQEVINRLSILSQPLPAGVVPQISPQNPIGEIYRYTLKSPQDRYGNDIYTLNDLKALQDWVLEREFRRVPHVMDVTSTGGTIKRYEVHPDPDRLKRYGVTLAQLQTALTNSNQNVGADLLVQGDIVLNVRSVGLYGGGLDPVEQVLGLTDPVKAAAKLREEEERRLYEIRQIVIASVNNRPVKIEHIVEGGPLAPGEALGKRGVVVGHQTRLGKVSLSKPPQTTEQPGVQGSDESTKNRGWRDEKDKIQCIVLLRVGEKTIPAVNAVKEKVAELNNPDYGRMLPGVQIEPYYDRNDLVHVTTETVTENVLTGILLVCVVLLMFLSSIRTALIMAINVPLALLFAVSLLYFRGKSANLLSLGAVDFGIIVDSSVIMIENIYRHLAAGEYAELPLVERIVRFTREIDRALFFSTAIMVCAFIPLFTMFGPEGQLFGPMAETYAFALGGALLLAMTLTPVMCLLMFRKFKPVHENFLVRFLKSRYIWQLQICLRFRWVTIGVMLLLIIGSSCLIPFIGGEFMPQLEEGNFWITAMFPLNVSMDRVAQVMDRARAVIASYPEIEVLVPAIGRPDDGTDPTGYYRVEIFAPLKEMKDWPKTVDVKGWRSIFEGNKRPRTKDELKLAMNKELRNIFPGVDWNFSQYIRDNVMEALAGVKGDNSVKIFGPDLEKLEEMAAKVKNRLEVIDGIAEVGIFNIKGQSHLEFRVDLDKCAKWGVSAADVNNLIQSAVGGKALTSMIEGEKLFDVTLRWPHWKRSSETSILDMQVDISNNQVVPVNGPGFTPSPIGTGMTGPAPVGTQVNTANPITNTPRLTLRDLVSPVGRNGAPDPKGTFERAGASTIYREQGKRMIAIKFNVGSYRDKDGVLRRRDLASAVAEAKDKTYDLIERPYRTVWDGEFNEMEKAQKRMLLVIPLSLGLIFVLLYVAFRSFLDAIVIMTNVFDLGIGGLWALYLTGTHFSISAAVGFVSLFGVAIMEGLLMISYFNALRAQGLSLHDSIVQGAAKRVRPVMITALTAILGLLPAALALRPTLDASNHLMWVEQIGSQTQQPLAIVVVGGMMMTLFLDRYLMPVLYSFYGHREPVGNASSLAH